VRGCDQRRDRLRLGNFSPKRVRSHCKGGENESWMMARNRTHWPPVIALRLQLVRLGSAGLKAACLWRRAIAPPMFTQPGIRGLTRVGARY